MSAAVSHYMVIARDRADGLETREQTRPAHRRYLRNPAPHRVRVILAGPVCDTTTQLMRGTLLIVEARSTEEVARFIADDPYSRAGLFVSVDIGIWTCGLGSYEPSPETRPLPLDDSDSAEPVT